MHACVCFLVLARTMVLSDHQLLIIIIRQAYLWWFKKKSIQNTHMTLSIMIIYKNYKQKKPKRFWRNKKRKWNWINICFHSDDDDHHHIMKITNKTKQNKTKKRKKQKYRTRVDHNNNRATIYTFVDWLGFIYDDDEVIIIIIINTNW